MKEIHNVDKHASQETRKMLFQGFESMAPTPHTITLFASDSTDASMEQELSNAHTFHLDNILEISFCFHCTNIHKRQLNVALDRVNLLYNRKQRWSFIIFDHYTHAVSVKCCK